MKTKKIKASYVFNTFGFILLILSIVLYARFENAKENITTVNTQANLDYVKSLINNLSDDVIRVVNKNIQKSILDDVILKEYIEADLKLFITTKYKRIYIVAKNDDDKVFILADSNDVVKDIHPHLKSHLKYVYDNQKFLYTEHTNNHESHGAEYVKPIIIDGIVEALIVVEFTLAEQKTITDELEALSEVLAFIILFLFIVFAFIIWFSKTDEKRELEKNIAFEELSKSNQKLALESQKVYELNDTLEIKVKHAVEKNRLQDKQMIEQSRLAQMGEMISMIAHQWRQPLAAISATTVNMNFQAQLGKLDHEKIIELSEKISGYSQHLSATIDDFRDFFKSNKVAKETNFLEIIDSVTNIIEVSILNSNIDFVKNINNNDPFVTYVNEVKQVVLNLIKNAEDVLIEKEIVSPRIIVTTFKYKDNFIFEVADNGGGIDEKVLDSIFDPYITTKKNTGGTGLGLYMSKIIIEEHCNGKLTARNNHEGAVFQIILGPTI